MAFRDPDYALDPTLVPSHLTLSNFKYAFNTTNNHFGRSLVNGVIIGMCVTVLAMAVGVFAAYAMARLAVPLQVRSFSARSWRHRCSLALPS